MRKLIKIYQSFFSPLFIRQCRFYPTCSNYYLSVIEKYGEIKGFYLFLKRIKKCHPWNKGGIDLP